MFVRRAVRTRGKLFVARCACVYLFFGVQKRGQAGREGATFVGRNGGGVLGLFRSRGKKGRKTKKKGTDLSDLVLVVGGNTVVRSVGNDDGRVVDV